MLGSTIVRKSLLEDRQGERYSRNEKSDRRYELLILALSSYILRVTLPKPYSASHRLALESSPDVESLQVHCLMHSYQLARDVRKRKQVNGETQSFAKVLLEKEELLNQKERMQTTKVDVDSVVQDITAEKQRWERNWTTMKGDWVLDGLRTTISPLSPTHFFTQSYQDAFANHTPSSANQPTPTVIQASSALADENISRFVTMERDLSAEITRLEGLLGHHTPPRRSSFRKSLTPAPRTPSPSPEKQRANGYNLRFSRSMSRLSRSASESPKSPRSLTSDNGTF